MKDESDSDEEHVEFPCAHCGESRIDLLEWEDEETVRCRSCDRRYRPR
ncbi:MAG: hypothetical protein JWO13_439 [Acidobacteriales bacterium]|nr:hypothetical protein [Terriglobales bacterium]